MSGGGGRRAPAGPAGRRGLPSALDLPTPGVVGRMSVEEALVRRRSAREFDSVPLTMAELGQLLWAAQGISGEDGEGRSAPSAGRTYPLEIFGASAAGLFHYLPSSHSLQVLDRKDLRSALAEAALRQQWVARAAVVLVVVGVADRTAPRYGERAQRYVALETGHAAQNILLQAAALGLSGTPVGAFDDDRVRGLLGLPQEWAPIYLIPLGHAARE